MSQTTSPIGWKDIEGDPIQVVTVKFPMPIKQTDEKIVEMRVPIMRGVALVDDKVIAKICPTLSTDDRDLLVDLIEAYAQKQILRFSITIR